MLDDSATEDSADEISVFDDDTRTSKKGWKTARGLLRTLSDGYKISEAPAAAAALSNEFFANLNAEMCVDLLRHTSPKIYKNIRRRIAEADNDWMEAFFRSNGLNVLFQMLEEMTDSKRFSDSSLSSVVLPMYCVECVKAIMKNNRSMDLIVGQPDYALKLVQAIGSDKFAVRSNAVQLLSALAYYSERGCQVILDALQKFKQNSCRKYWTEILVDELKNQDTDYKASLMALINCIMFNVDSDKRIKIRNELLAVGLKDLLQKLHEQATGSDPLSIQLALFDEYSDKDRQLIEPRIAEGLGSTELDINDPYDLFDAIMRKIGRTPFSSRLLTILQSLSLLDSDGQYCCQQWDLIEQFITAMCSLDNADAGTMVLLDYIQKQVTSLFANICKDCETQTEYEESNDLEKAVKSDQKLSRKPSQKCSSRRGSKKRSGIKKKLTKFWLSRKNRKDKKNIDGQVDSDFQIDGEPINDVHDANQSHILAACKQHTKGYKRTRKASSAPSALNRALKTGAAEPVRRFSAYSDQSPLSSLCSNHVSANQIRRSSLVNLFDDNSCSLVSIRARSAEITGKRSAKRHEPKPNDLAMSKLEDNSHGVEVASSPSNDITTTSSDDPQSFDACSPTSSTTNTEVDDVSGDAFSSDVVSSDNADTVVCDKSPNSAETLLDAMAKVCSPPPLSPSSVLTICPPPLRPLIPAALPLLGITRNRTRENVVARTNNGISDVVPPHNNYHVPPPSPVHTLERGPSVIPAPPPLPSFLASGRTAPPPPPVAPPLSLLLTSAAASRIRSGPPPPPPPPLPPPSSSLLSTANDIKALSINERFYTFPAQKCRKTKILYWNKVAPSLLAQKPNVLWNESADVSVNEVDLSKIEDLFCCETQPSTSNIDRNSICSLTLSQSDGAMVKALDQVYILDQKTSLKISLFLKQFRGLDIETIVGLVVDRGSDKLKEEQLTLERLRGLQRCLVGVEQYITDVQNYDGDYDRLGMAEKFIWHVGQHKYFAVQLDVKCLQKEFDDKHRNFANDLTSLIDCCQALRHNNSMKHFLFLTLRIGNYLNLGSSGGPAAGFKISSIKQLYSLKSTSQSSTTLLHVLVEYAENLSNKENPLNFAKELSIVHKAVKIDYETTKAEIVVWASEVKKLIDLVRSTTDAQFTERTDLFFMKAESLLKDLIDVKVIDVEKLSKALQEYFCDELKLNDMLKLFSEFLKAVEQAKIDNDQRKLKDQRLAKQRELQEIRKASVANASDHLRKSRSSIREDNLVESLLTKIRDGDIAPRCRDFTSLHDSPRKARQFTKCVIMGDQSRERVNKESFLR